MSRPDHDPTNPECGCFGCHIRSVQWAPSATPTRARRVGTPAPQNNSWEKGIPRDSRGMPYLDANLNEVGQKDYSANRSTIEAKVREMRNAPAPPPQPTP